MKRQCDSARRNDIVLSVYKRYKALTRASWKITMKTPVSVKFRRNTACVVRGASGDSGKELVYCFNVLRNGQPTTPLDLTLYYINHGDIKFMSSSQLRFHLKL